MFMHMTAFVALLHIYNLQLYTIYGITVYHIYYILLLIINNKVYIIYVLYAYGMDYY